MNKEMEIQVGDTIIHEGKTKKVDQKMGDVLILNDKITTSVLDVSLISKPKTLKCKKREHTPELPEEDNTERVALRNAIEDLNPSTPVAVVMNVMSRVDSCMRINAGTEFDLSKADLIRTALELRKINPKTCESCGQVIND